MSGQSNYDKHPAVVVTGCGDCAWQGWVSIVERLRGDVGRGVTRVVVECYPGVFEDEIAVALVQGLRPDNIFRVRDCLRSPVEIEALVAPDLTDDPVFGRMNGFTLQEFFDPLRLAMMQARYAGASGLRLVIGTGAALLDSEPGLLIYADMARWKIQMRQRAGRAGNLGADNLRERASLKYKRAFFLDWRAADRLKKQVFPSADYILDTHEASAPKLVTGEALRKGLRQTTLRPFRVVPFFDPGPWGGEWMRRQFHLPADPPNYAWCFDCVPEENSLLLNFGAVTVELPSIDLVFQQPRELLGDAVHARFGTEFPIRFDFLDTMEGGNLSLQVHPLTEYIYDKFGMAYTQDESYYLLDAGADACVYLGFKSGIDRSRMLCDLKAAQNGEKLFPAEEYVNKWPARKHDHFLIPAGTIHCSGANSMVLEISATPYIFTFKLWDWARLGLDGRPRIVHLEHGAANLQWDRDHDWVKTNLINRLEQMGSGPGWREERTGLHEREFIETRRHWFNGRVEHRTQGGVHVLNLVEGREIIVESPTNAWEPYHVHYAETFIAPAAVGRYTIRPANGSEPCATVRASVRTNP